jgi:DNA mismatch repair protein MutS
MDGDTSLYIITGPNMGGKSTYCRSVAIAFVMAQMGSYVPAASAALPIRNRLFARVGASDDLRGGQSTFMMEMNEVAHILQYATERSLVILDEVGRGTGTYDGLSVAWSVSQYLVNALKAKTLFATHYLELTTLAQIYPRVKNLSLVVEEEGERIVFLHKILPGSANKRYGVHVARLAGLPEEVIEGALAKLSELEEQKESGPMGAAPPDQDRAHEQGQAYANGPLDDGEGAHAQSFQMSLFQEGGAQGLAGALPNPDRQGTKEQKAIQELLKKNLGKTSPIDALNFLYRLQNDLNKR